MLSPNSRNIAVPVPYPLWEQCLKSLKWSASTAQLKILDSSALLSKMNSARTLDFYLLLSSKVYGM